MQHTIREIIEQCKLRWTLSDDFTKQELESWINCADTILAEIEKEGELKCFIK